MKTEPPFICLPNFQQVVGLAMVPVAAQPGNRLRHRLTVDAQQGLQQPVVCWYFLHLQRKVVVYTDDYNARYMKSHSSLHTQMIETKYETKQTNSAILAHKFRKGACEKSFLCKEMHCIHGTVQSVLETMYKATIIWLESSL